MISLKNILLPTDLSEPSRHATKYAIEFARQFDATLHLLYVIEEPPFYAPLGGYFPTHEEWEAFADSGLQEWIVEDDAAGLTIIREKVYGHPVPKIVEYAADHEIDMIVIGTHGRSAIPHLLLGSKAENIIRHSPCPVFTVRPKQHEFVMP
ncbi:MAG: universal stress protein [Fuerstiella sp.]